MAKRVVDFTNVDGVPEKMPVARALWVTPAHLMGDGKFPDISFPANIYHDNAGTDVPESIKNRVIELVLPGGWCARVMVVPSITSPQAYDVALTVDGGYSHRDDAEEVAIGIAHDLTRHGYAVGFDLRPGGGA